MEIEATPSPERYVFTGWSDGDTNPHCWVLLSSDSTILANFIDTDTSSHEGIAVAPASDIRFMIHPNPAHEYFRVTIQENEDGILDQQYTLILNDSVGREQLRRPQDHQSSEISTAFLHDGICFVTILSQSGSVAQKLMVR